MIEYFEISMWFQISIKLKRTVEQSKVIINNMNHRFMNDKDFKIMEHNPELRDAFEFYLATKKAFNLD